MFYVGDGFYKNGQFYQPILWMADYKWNPEKSAKEIEIFGKIDYSIWDY